jgi:Fe2+ transport system protein FeoA
VIPGGGDNAAAVPLSTLPDGTRARFVRVEAGAGLKARLTAMGLSPGVGVTVVNNRGAGPFVVAVRDTRIVLGRGMAHKVFVVPAEREGQADAAGRR